MSDTKSREEAVVRVACVQMEPVVGHKQANVEKSLGLIGEAASNGPGDRPARAANSGYMFEPGGGFLALSEVVPEGETTKA